MQLKINQSHKSQSKLSTKVQEILRCPICNNQLEFRREDCRCRKPECKAVFPIINSIPILIDAASGYYFISGKSHKVLSDRDLIKLY